jgi:histidine ammonia-lyase
VTVLLDRHDELDLAAYRRVVDDGEPVRIAAAALERVEDGRRRLLALLAGGARVYGVTTGLGYLHGADVGTDEQAPLQRALLTARAAGLDEPLPASVVRGVLLLRLNGFLSGVVGVGPELCTFLAARLDDGWSPGVPSGPYGAAGEIGPLAHLFQTLVGEGDVLDGGSRVPARVALAARGIPPVELGPKEGLALVNGSPFATALGLDATRRFRTALDAAIVSAALEVALTRSSTRPFARRVGELGRDPVQARVHERLLELLDGGPLHEDLPQPPVSLRVAPQVLGAALDVVETTEARLERRLGAVTDSPLVLGAGPGEPEGLYPTGGFHAAGPALWLDGLALAAAHVVNLVEKRLHRLLDSRTSGLPDQLAVAPGRHAGVISLHKTVVGLAAEARLLASPASVHVLDTSAGQEDVQALTLLSAVRLGHALEALETALACELAALRQAAHLRGTPPGAPKLAAALELVAAHVDPVLDDRTLSPDVERARGLVRDGSLSGR